MTTPDGRTPSAPDVDQPDGGAHAGEDGLGLGGVEATLVDLAGEGLRQRSHHRIG